MNVYVKVSDMRGFLTLVSVGHPEVEFAPWAWLRMDLGRRMSSLCARRAWFQGCLFVS